MIALVPELGKQAAGRLGVQRNGMGALHRAVNRLRTSWGKVPSPCTPSGLAAGQLWEPHYEHITYQLHVFTFCTL